MSRTLPSNEEKFSVCSACLLLQFKLCSAIGVLFACIMIHIFGFVVFFLFFFGTGCSFLLQEQMQEVLDAMFEKKVIGFEFSYLT